MNSCRNLLLIGLFVVALAPRTFADEPAKKSLPIYRVDASDFEASEADIRAVCDSAAKQLWRHFPEYDLEPFVVTRGKSGPIVLYQRNDMREIVLKLDTSNTFWSQYAYQFGHEFCHILCRYRPSDGKNLWFEETLCETASLYVLRSMARDWKKSPPYRNWTDYRDSLRDYADDQIRKREHVREIHASGLAAFYRSHAEELRKNATNRELNGAMAVVLLARLEEKPEHWEAVRWLNETAAPKDEALTAYLARWYAAAPEKHQPFIRDVAELFGHPIAVAKPAGNE
ncbi:hypothetical protein [Anatilimnocola floriformis]|uniref:hypothetical protein n=1 Tax=Anatilimnocola floriformis TaxID=2948575 RepID=UPI0020C30274|nr:hypothetical protein [Anatilimnocola floriformis]